ncbi:MAG: hypothetical protein ABSC47_13845 [Terracidiphilus sp.]|jgi:hypothetical protein
MRYSKAILMLACAMALPALCQAQQETSEPESSKAITLKACGDGPEVNFSQKTDKHLHPMGVQTADKALIYVLRDTMYGMAIQTKLAVDGQWVGVNRGNN